jgi:hypothetical protein
MVSPDILYNARQQKQLETGGLEREEERKERKKIIKRFIHTFVDDMARSKPSASF